MRKYFYILPRDGALSGLKLPSFNGMSRSDRLTVSDAAIKKKRTCRYDCTELCQLKGTSHGTCLGSICKCSTLNAIVEELHDRDT
uniref:SFRICE_006968 n=1 Tax=Spodoptera frugiperda TaxID=7108 RepID=A0A2H1W8Y4_SPOFR